MKGNKRLEKGREGKRREEREGKEMEGNGGIKP